MTERTVTVQTEEEQTVTICDHCGLGDDEGEIIAFKPKERKHWGEIDCIDIHRDCLEDLGVDVPDKPTYADVGKEATQGVDGPILALGWGELLLTGVGVVAFWLSGQMPLQPDSVLAPMFEAMAPLIAIMGVLCVLFALLNARSTATKTVDEL